MVFILFGLITLLVSSRCKHSVFAKQEKQQNSTPSSLATLEILDLEHSLNDGDSKQSVDSSVDEFLTQFDLEVIESLFYSYNRPCELLKISIPALLSLALCPFTLYLYEPFTVFLWPKEEYKAPPDINDAIACFLAPAGLVYATSFGFAFQQALSKQHYILQKVTNEISMVDQIATFTSRLQLKRPSLRRDIYRAIKAEAIFMILQILNRDQHSYVNKPTEDVKVKIWSVVDMLRDVETDDKHHIDKVICEKIMSHIMALNSICSDRMGVLHSKIHPVKWAFLETLGFFSFIGILLLQAFSYRMELVMCIITVFSISLLCFVVSDLDSPFSGFFRVDLSVLIQVIKRLETMYYDDLQDSSGSCSTMTTFLNEENSSIFDKFTVRKHKI